MPQDSEHFGQRGSLGLVVCALGRWRLEPEQIGAHALTPFRTREVLFVVSPKFPEIPENGVLRLSNTPKFPAAPIRGGGNRGKPGGAVKQAISSPPGKSKAHG